MVLYELFSPFGKRNTRCEYAASESSGEVLDTLELEKILRETGRS